MPAPWFERQKRLERSRRLSHIMQGLGLVLGVALIVVAVWRSGSVSNASADLLSQLLLASATALLSATLVGLTIGRSTQEELTVALTSSLEETLENLLTPVRAHVFSDVLYRYRWDCRLSPPRQGDPYPDLAEQHIRISFDCDSLPSELIVVAFATANDAVLRPYADDRRCVFRWMVDGNADVSDDQAFSVGEIRIDGEPLRLLSDDTISPAVDGEQVKGRLLTWEVPSILRARGGAVDFSVLTRKTVSPDRSTPARVSVFRTVSDAEFRLVVDRAIGCGDIKVSTTQVTALGPDRWAWSGPAYNTRAGRTETALASFHAPLQRGSTVVFSIEPEPREGDPTRSEPPVREVAEASGTVVDLSTATEVNRGR